MTSRISQRECQSCRSRLETNVLTTPPPPPSAGPPYHRGNTESIVSNTAFVRLGSHRGIRYTVYDIRYLLFAIRYTLYGHGGSHKAARVPHLNVLLAPSNWTLYRYIYI